MLLSVRQCTLSGIKIQCVVVVSLILEAAEGGRTSMNWIVLFSSHLVRFDMKVVVFGVQVQLGFIVCMTFDCDILCLCPSCTSFPLCLSSTLLFLLRILSLTNEG